MKHYLTKIIVIIISSASVFMTAPVLLTGCGVEVGNPVTGKGGKNSETMALNGEVVAMQMDEALAALAESYGEVAGSSLLLSPKQGQGADATSAGGAVEHEFSCKEEEDHITVTRSLEKASPIAANDGMFNRKLDMSFSDLMTARYSNSEEGISCNASGRKASFDISRMSEWKADITFSKQRQRTIRRSSQDGTETTIRNDRYESSGSRSIVSTKLEQNPLSIEQAITHDFLRTSHWESPVAGVTEITSHVYTAKDEPLVVRRDFENSAKSPTQSTIQSGSLIAEQSNGSMIRLTFSNVTFDKNGQCRPTGGTISGQVATTASPTDITVQFTVDFSTSEQPIMLLEDGQSFDLYLDYCSFD